MKHTEVSSMTNREMIPPLLPCRPPNPVLTEILATSRKLADSDVLTKMHEKSCRSIEFSDGELWKVTTHPDHVADVDDGVGALGRHVESDSLHELVVPKTVT